MTSLRRRIILGTVVATSSVVLIAAIAAWIATHVTLVASADRKLGDITQMFTTLADRYGIRILTYLPLPPPLRDQNSSEMFQLIHAADGRELVRGPGLQNGFELPALAPADWDGSPRMIEHGGRLFRMRRLTRETAGAPEDTVHFYAALDLTDSFAELNTLGYILLGTWLTSTCLAFMASLWLQRAILRPLRRIDDCLIEMGPERLDRRIETSVAPRELTTTLNHLNQLLDRLSSGIARERTTLAHLAHELRTPVAGLRCALEFALTETGDIERATAERCLRIVTDLQRMSTNLLSLARLESGHERPTPTRVDCIDAVNEAWEGLLTQAAARRVALTGDRERIDLIAWASADHVRPVFANLLENAISYSPEGAAIRLDTALVDNCCLIRLSNPSTVALPSEPFQPFVRGDAARSDRHHVGLGLALTKRLIELQGGTIAIVNGLPGSFTIEVRLPLPPDAA